MRGKLNYHINIYTLLDKNSIHAYTYIGVTIATVLQYYIASCDKGSFYWSLNVLTRCEYSSSG